MRRIPFVITGAATLLISGGAYAATIPAPGPASSTARQLVRDHPRGEAEVRQGEGEIRAREAGDVRREDRVRGTDDTARSVVTTMPTVVGVESGDDRGRGAHVESGDDRGRGAHVESGDDRGRGAHVEPGDDRGRGAHVEPGDDHGGDRPRPERPVSTVAPTPGPTPNPTTPRVDDSGHRGGRGSDDSGADDHGSREAESGDDRGGDRSGGR